LSRDLDQSLEFTLESHPTALGNDLYHFLLPALALLNSRVIPSPSESAAPVASPAA
jgi:hypothetical protein